MINHHDTRYKPHQKKRTKEQPQNPMDSGENSSYPHLSYVLFNERLSLQRTLFSFQICQSIYGAKQNECDSRKVLE